MTHITVPVSLSERSYDIHIGAHLLERAGEIISNLSGRKIFVLHDSAVKSHAASLLKAFPDGSLVRTLAVDGGEKSKSYPALQDVLSWLLSNGVDRGSVLFTLGGGVIGDLGGFAASIVLRGIDFVQVPTTLLAQVDSSVGGKTGINAAQGKNLIGSFYQPIAVLCDTETLKTLPEREIKAGYAEIVKYAALGSRDFFEWLDSHGADVLALRPDAAADAIETSCRMKAEIVEEDEREQAGGRRALLNLGHTFAHALEAACGYDGRLLHGEAVSIGLVLAVRLSVRMGLAPAQDAARLENHLRALGLKTSISDITPALTHTVDELIALMGADKKAKSGKIGFILLRGIGYAFQNFDVDIGDVRAILDGQMIR